MLGKYNYVVAKSLYKTQRSPMSLIFLVYRVLYPVLYTIVVFIMSHPPETPPRSRRGFSGDGGNLRRARDNIGQIQHLHLKIKTYTNQRASDKAQELRFLSRIQENMF